MQTRTKRRSSTRVDVSPAAPNSHPSAELYEKARVAYIAAGSIKAIREATGLSEKASVRILDSGVPALGLPSLRDAARLEASKVEARLRRKEDQAATVEANELAKVMEARASASRRSREHEVKVLGDAERSRAEEVRLVRLNRISATVLAQVNAELLQVSSSLARSLLEDKEKLARLSPKERLGILRTVAGIVHRTAQASAGAVNMERLLMGEPTAILGRTDAGPSTKDMTPEEAEQWLSLANRAFARRANRRTVVDVAVVDEGEEEEQILELTEQNG